MTSRPTLDRLRERALADFALEMGSDEVLLSGSFERACVQANVGLTHGLYGYLQYVKENIVPSPSNDPAMLVKHTGVYGISPNDATYATFRIQGLRNGVASIPAGTRWATPTVTYETTEDVAADTAAFTVEVRALTAGPEGNVVAGTVLTLQSTILGVLSQAVVSGAPGSIQGGAVQAEEPVELYERFEARVQSPVPIGRASDWVQWAKDAGLGVTRAWALTVPQNHPGVSVLACKDSYDATGFFLGTSLLSWEEVDELEAYLLTVVPAPAQPRPFPGETLGVELELALVPNTASAQASATAAVNDLLIRLGGPLLTITEEQVEQALSTIPELSAYTITTSNLPATASGSQVHTLQALSFV